MTDGGVVKSIGRRDFLHRLALGVAGLGLRPGPAAAQASQAVAPTATAGVSLLRTFYLQGKLPVAPTKALPGLNWVQRVSGPLLYLVPPDWSATGPAAPIDTARSLVDIVGISLVAPHASAAWMTFLALSLAGGTADQSATFGLADLAAQLFPAPVTPTIISVERSSLLGASITFVVVRLGNLLAVVRGGSHVVRSGAVVSDAVFYDAMAAAEAHFTETTRTVFLPFVYEHLGGGGGTPTADANSRGET